MYLIVTFISIYIVHCHINKYHKRVPIICNYQCISTQNHELVIHSKDAFNQPQFNTSTEIHYQLFDQNNLIFKKIAQGASAEVYIIQNTINQKFSIIKRYFGNINIKRFQNENYIMNLMGYNITWIHYPIYNEILSSHQYSEVRNLSDIQVINQEVKVIMYKLIKQVDKAHRKGIIHSDIKSQNILIDVQKIGDMYRTQKMKIQLIDWNLAELYYEGKRFKKASGTPSYKAPQLIIKSEFYTPVVDVWSIGMVMFELITSRKLIHSHYDTEVQQMIKLFGFQKFIKFYNIMQVGAEILFMQQIIASQNFTSTYQQRINDQKLDDQQKIIIKKMLTFEPWKRPSCQQLLKDQYFKNLKTFDISMLQKTQKRKKQSQSQRNINRKKKEQNNDVHEYQTKQ